MHLKRITTDLVINGDEVVALTVVSNRLLLKNSTQYSVRIFTTGGHIWDTGNFNDKKDAQDFMMKLIKEWGK